MLCKQCAPGVAHRKGKRKRETRNPGTSCHPWDAPGVVNVNVVVCTQGDFVVPSSRQDLDLDSPWNQLLRSKVPKLFTAAFARFCALPVPPGQGELFWLDWWLRCVPLQEHMHVSWAQALKGVA